MNKKIKLVYMTLFMMYIINYMESSLLWNKKWRFGNSWFYY